MWTCHGSKLEANHNVMVASPEGIAYVQSFIGRAALIEHGNALLNSGYGWYLLHLANGPA